MVIFDIAASFIVSAAIGVRGKGERRDLALLAGGLGMGVPGLYFLEKYPDWDWQYLLDPTHLPTGVPALFISLILIACLLGHHLGGKYPKLVPVYLACFVIYVLCFWHQTLYVGNLAEYQAGTAAFVPGGFIRDLILMGPPGAIVLSYCWWRSAPG